MHLGVIFKSKNLNMNAENMENTENKENKIPSREASPHADRPRRHRRMRAKPVTLRQLKQYKNYLQALSNVKDERDLLEILRRMRNADFRVVCTCMHDFLYDEGLMKNYFTPEETSRLKHMIKPWSKKLVKFTNAGLDISEKKKLLSSKQKGGQAMLAAIVGSLLPMAVSAVTKYLENHE